MKKKYPLIFLVLIGITASTAAFAVTLIENPDKIESYLVESIPSLSRDSMPRIDKWTIQKQGSDLSFDQAQELEKILLNEKNFDASLIKDCGFFPGPVFRFIDQNQIVDVLLCFQCDEIRVLRYQGAGIEPLAVSLGFSTETRNQLLEFVRKIFPEFQTADHNASEVNFKDVLKKDWETQNNKDEIQKQGWGNCFEPKLERYRLPKGHRTVPSTKGTG